MTFFAFGLNHESAPMKLREAFALTEQAKRQLYAELNLSQEAELVLLSTCNRTEAYLFGEPDDIEAVREALCREAGRSWPEADFVLEDEEAVRHVLEVTCGLRSLVVGETQILAQVKSAYRLAVEAQRVETVLHRLLHTAFRTAKRVVHETALTSGAASVSSAAVAMARGFLARRFARGLNGRRVLLLGTGRMGELALKALQSYDLKALEVTNRTAERASKAVARGAQLVEWADRYEAVRRVDLVIVATGAEEPVLEADPLTAKPMEDPTLFIDIAVPRNVATAVAKVSGCTVYDLDTLNEQLVRVEKRRRSAVPAAGEIVEEELSEYVSWFFHQQALQPAIHVLRDTFDSIRRQEIKRHEHRFSEADQAELHRITESIMQKLLAVPIVRLKNTDPESIDFVRGIRLLNRLFSRPGCDETEEPRRGNPHLEEAGSDEELDAETIREHLALYQSLRTPAGYEKSGSYKSPEDITG